ncbi:Ig domain protein group 2 domain protein (fragment) [Vibrio coralliirubri]|uniref:Ig-like domain-containing protein n=1 Tax=Vibrio coralliirubri TaxID=1516159 RepID=UPI0006318438
MNKYFKSLLAIVIFPLLMLLTGCNSEGAFSESSVKLERIDIVASPIKMSGVSNLTLAVGYKQSFEAVGHYSDGSSRTLTDLNVSNWHTNNSDAGYFDEPSVFTATNEGKTTLTATKDGITSNTVDVNVSAAVIISIQVTPSPVSIAKGQTQKLLATATFSDATSSDVSNSVTWTPIDTATATVSPNGLLSAVEVGNTTLTATKDGITSNSVDVNVCSLAGPCIDIFDTGSGKLFTSSPSVAYLESIGGSATNSIRVESTHDDGEFYRFDWGNAVTLCATYNTNSVGGRTNWRLATDDELFVELYGTYGNFFSARAWPVSYPYWSETIETIAPKNPFNTNLSNGYNDTSHYNNAEYASCVSNP